MKILFMGSATIPDIRMVLSKNAGAFTPTLGEPKILLAACCKIRLIPQVTRRLSAALPYNLQITSRSST